MSADSSARKTRVVVVVGAVVVVVGVVVKVVIEIDEAADVAAVVVIGTVDSPQATTDRVKTARTAASRIFLKDYLRRQSTIDSSKIRLFHYIAIGMI